MITGGTALLPRCVFWIFHFGVQGANAYQGCVWYVLRHFPFLGRVGCSRVAWSTEQLVMPNSEQLLVSRCARPAANSRVCVVCDVGYRYARLRTSAGLSPPRTRPTLFAVGLFIFQTTCHIVRHIALVHSMQNAALSKSPNVVFVVTRLGIFCVRCLILSSRSAPTARVLLVATLDS